MQIPILVNPLPDGRGFEARAGDPFDLVVERSTVLEAIDSLEAMMRAKLAQGAQVFHIDIGPKPTRIRTTDGIPDDEMTREWREAIEAYRRECDEPFPGEMNQLDESEKQPA